MAKEKLLTEADKAKREDENFEMRQNGGPIKKAYPDGAEAEAPVHKPAETIVEHPLAPTDTNPNPGQEPGNGFTAVATADGVSEPDEGPIEIEGTHDHPVHLGDGRVLHKGSREKVSKDLVKDPNLKGKFKRV